MIDAFKPGSGGKCFLYVDDVKVAEGYIPVTQPFGYSADEGWNVGADHETPVSEDYKERDNKFTGKITKALGMLINRISLSFKEMIILLQD